MRTPDFKDSFVATCKREHVVCVPCKHFDFLLCYAGVSAFIDILDVGPGGTVEFKQTPLKNLSEMSVGGAAGWVVRAGEEIFFVQAKVVKMLDRAIGPDDGIDLGKRNNFSIKKIFTFSSCHPQKKRKNHH